MYAAVTLPGKSRKAAANVEILWKQTGNEILKKPTNREIAPSTQFRPGFHGACRSLRLEIPTFTNFLSRKNLRFSEVIRGALLLKISGLAHVQEQVRPDDL